MHTSRTVEGKIVENPVKKILLSDIVLKTKDRCTSIAINKEENIRYQLEAYG